MSYHARIETSEYASFLTTRSRNSELWLINNTPLEEAILGYAALCKGRYGVALYGLAIEGNHIQGPATFAKENRASFMRDFTERRGDSLFMLLQSYVLTKRNFA